MQFTKLIKKNKIEKLLFITKKSFELNKTKENLIFKNGLTSVFKSRDLCPIINDSLPFLVCVTQDDLLKKTEILLSLLYFISLTLFSPSNT